MAEFTEVMKRKQEMCDYYESCHDCPLYIVNNTQKRNCRVYVEKYPEEAEKVIMEWQKPVDWSKVAIDTKVLVSGDGID